ncbi:MAG: hypothetical protein HYX69_01860 [Planctomycetia bacterium]|nr:hypothetical protein [Planctomycetia bacterium]
MRLIEIDWNPPDRQLRQFGWIALVGLPLAGWLASGKPWPADATTVQQTVVGVLAVLGAVCAILAIARPRLLRLPFLAAMLVALPIGLVVSEVMLLVIYFVLFVPVGLVFKLLSRDALERRIDKSAKTYWQPKAQPSGPESYFRQS